MAATVATNEWAEREVRRNGNRGGPQGSTPEGNGIDGKETVRGKFELGYQ